MPSNRLLSSDPKAGVLLSSDPSAGQRPSAPSTTEFMTPEKWAALTPAERARNVLKWGGNVIVGMTGMGATGREAVEHPIITLATAVVPATRSVKAVMPSKVRAGANFQEVMGTARNAPVDISLPGNQALRIMQLSERGATLPKVVRDFLKRITDPNKKPLVYEEARDFASNISRLSADEFNRLNPALRRELGTLRVTLNTAVEKAAASVGKGEQYRSAMREYARRSTLDDLASDVWKGVKRGLPLAGAVGLGSYGASRISDLFRSE